MDILKKIAKLISHGGEGTACTTSTQACRVCEDPRFFRLSIFREFKIYKDFFWISYSLNLNPNISVWPLLLVRQITGNSNGTVLSIPVRYHHEKILQIPSSSFPVRVLDVRFMM